MNIEAAEAFELLRREIQELGSPWKTVKQAAAYLQTSPSTIHGLINKGTLKSKYLGACPRLHRDDLDKILKVRKEAIKQTSLPLDVPIPA